MLDKVFSLAKNGNVDKMNFDSWIACLFFNVKCNIFSWKPFFKLILILLDKFRKSLIKFKDLFYSNNKCKGEDNVLSNAFTLIVGSDNKKVNKSSFSSKQQ